MRSAAENAVYFQRCGQLLNILSNAKRLQVVLRWPTVSKALHIWLKKLIYHNRRFLSISPKCARRALCARDAKDLLSIIAW